jgi:hypothetical protein
MRNKSRVIYQRGWVESYTDPSMKISGILIEIKLMLVAIAPGEGGAFKSLLSK